MKRYTKKDIKRIGRALARLGMVSELARRTGKHRTSVSAALNGRTTSRPIVEAAEAFLAELQAAEERRQKPAA